MKDIEVELKFKLPQGKREQLLELMKKDGIFVHEQHIKDSYYAPTYRNFFAVRPIVEWLRIRESDKGHSINYKHRIIKDGVNMNYCDEYNTPITKPDQLEKILQALDLKPIVVVDKVRTSYMYQQVEVSLDVVQELGDFVELEMKGQFNSPEEARKKLYVMAEDLGLERDWQDEKGYPWDMMEAKGII